MTFLLKLRAILTKLTDILLIGRKAGLYEKKPGDLGDGGQNFPK